MFSVRCAAAIALTVAVSVPALAQTQTPSAPANPIVRRLQALRDSFMGGGGSRENGRSPEQRPPQAQPQQAPERQVPPTPTSRRRGAAPSRQPAAAAPRATTPPSGYQSQDAEPAVQRYRISRAPSGAAVTGESAATTPTQPSTSTSQRRRSDGSEIARADRLSPQSADDLRSRLETLRAGGQANAPARAASDGESASADRSEDSPATSNRPAVPSNAGNLPVPLDALVDAAVEQEFTPTAPSAPAAAPTSATGAASEATEESPAPNAPAAAGDAAGGPWQGLAIEETAPPARTMTRRRGAVLATRRMPTLDVAVMGPDTIKIGRPADYEVVVANVGTVDAGEVTIAVELPVWTDLVDAGGPSAAQPSVVRSQDGQARTLIWKLPSLVAEGEQRLSLRLKPLQSRSFDLAVQCTCSPASAQTMVEVQEPKLHLDIVGPSEIAYGEKRTFRLQLSNPGSGDAEDVALSVYVGQGVEQSASETIARLSAGDSKVLELELEAREAGAIAIRAEAVAAGGAAAEATESVLVRRAVLAIDAVGPKYLYARSPAVYRVRVRNTGNTTAEKVRVSAMLPTGAEYESTTTGGEFNAERGLVTWNLPRLEAGGETIVDVRCVLNSAGENRFRVGVAADRDVTGTAACATKVAGLADLKLEVRDPAGAAPVGGEMQYEITVQNRGTETVSGVHLVAYFSEGVEPLRVDGATADIFAADGAVDVPQLPTLRAGEKLELRVTAKAATPGVHTFRVELECPELEIRLSEDETTRFYSEESVAGQFDDELFR